MIGNVVMLSINTLVLLLVCQNIKSIEWRVFAVCMWLYRVSKTCPVLSSPVQFNHIWLNWPPRCSSVCIIFFACLWVYLRHYFTSTSLAVSFKMRFSLFFVISSCSFDVFSSLILFTSKISNQTNFGVLCAHLLHTHTHTQVVLILLELRIYTHLYENWTPFVTSQNVANSSSWSHFFFICFISFYAPNFFLNLLFRYFCLETVCAMLLNNKFGWSIVRE